MPEDDVEEYRRFMAIKSVLELERRCATPAIRVDNVWHTHIIHTRNYSRFCQVR
jgi:hypothetical protein